MICVILRYPMRKYLTPKEEFDTRKHLRHYPRPYSNIGLRATFGYACKLPMPGPTFLRDINEARVLRLLKEKGVLSRAELARYLGSTRSTVTLVSNELIKEGLIVPTGEGNFNLKEELLSKFPLPAFAENDANAAALAELSLAGRVGYSDLCLIYLDLGAGAGIISDRKLLRGHSGLAGEIGHFCFDPAKGRPDEELGPLETYLGRNYLLASYQRAGGKAKDLTGLLEDLKRNGPKRAEGS
jgi:hypothetical protein